MRASQDSSLNGSIDNGNQPLLTPDDSQEYSLAFPNPNNNELSLCGLPLTYRKKDASKLILYTVGSLLTLVIVAVVSVVLIMSKPPSPPPVRGVILMISDGIPLIIKGFGPASQTMARNYYQQINSLPDGTKLALDDILVGSSRTRSSSSLVTDSAAGATAFSCGLKTYNGAIGVDPQGRPCGTVLEAAKEKGYLTALVATSRITHGIPAITKPHLQVSAHMLHPVHQRTI